MVLGMLFTVLLAGGCARPYHWYRCGGCVNYEYCPPAPLPYTFYDGCPTPVSNAYHELLGSRLEVSAKRGDGGF